MNSQPPGRLIPHHVALKVRRLDAAERFYAGILGLPVIRRLSDEAGVPRSIWLEAGGMILMLERSNVAASALSGPCDTGNGPTTARVGEALAREPTPGEALAPERETGAALPREPMPGAALAREPMLGEALARGPAALPAFTDDPPGWHLLALRIDASERAAWRSYLVASGVPIVYESPFSVYVQDLEGNRLALSHYPEASPAGRVCT